MGSESHLTRSILAAAQGRWDDVDYGTNRSVREWGLAGIELRPIPGLMAYAAGSDGEIYSFVRRNWDKARNPLPRYTTSPARVRGVDTQNGYLAFVVCRKRPARKARRFYVHRMVASAFHGPCPGGMECSHLDGDRKNNRPENLAWESGKMNNRRKMAHGTVMHGTAVPCSRLTEDDVREIRRLRHGGAKYKDIAQLFNVCRGTVEYAARGVTWKRVTDVPPCPRVR